MKGKQKITAFLIFGAVALFLVTLAVLLKLEKGAIMNNEKDFLVRLPAVAGQFYPEEEGEARKQIKTFLAEANFAFSLPPQIIIVPHAGWSYSGPVAAYGFNLLKSSGFNRVILLGTTHRSSTDKIVLDDHDFWQTPLGQVSTDKNLIANLVDQGVIVVNRRTHQDDHVLEVELPFLQTVLSDFSIVPILIGQVKDSDLLALAQKLTTILANDPRTLLVISSDLSHYPDQVTAKAADGKTLAAIASGKREKFDQTLAGLANQYPAVDTFACGADAIRVGLLIADKIGLKEAKILKQSDSGAVSGQTEQVVGYGAVAFWLKQEQDFVGIDQEEKQILLSWAREALTGYLAIGQIPLKKAPKVSLETKRAVFVTLKKNGQLRGCLGGFEAKEPVWQAVANMAIAAAANDPRFSPVTKDELEDITIEVSLLSPLKKVTSWEEVELGKHGVYLKQGSLTGTFLPQVAQEGDWTKEDFLGEICAQKMGLNRDCYLDPATEIFIYTVESFTE
ncbi:MAG: AmmeMemoRadiSam system protein B [Patescibacteria group bacterium]|jgi:AmmeMemoRadiSam system protein B/AmmeMemoRadiSam system protein A